MKHVYVIGIGLIGGSMAMEVKRLHPSATIFGIDKSSDHLQTALSLNIIDEIATIDSIQEDSLVILSIPVDAAIELIPKLLSKIPKNTWVMDVGSTKAGICGAVVNHPNRKQFLAAHPIAGTEFSGPTAAHLGLFKNKVNIICEPERSATRVKEKGVELLTAMGMRTRYMEAKDHDKHIAYVSHLSHISSFLLGKTVIEKEKNERNIFNMAGSGFESTVRLAKSSPATWTPIFKQNKTNVIEALDEYIKNLIEFKDLMSADDFPAVYETMEQTNRIKGILKGIVPAYEK